jgi:hypothetical protein
MTPHELNDCAAQLLVSERSPVGVPGVHGQRLDSLRIGGRERHCDTATTRDPENAPRLDLQLIQNAHQQGNLISQRPRLKQASTIGCARPGPVIADD